MSNLTTLTASTDMGFLLPLPVVFRTFTITLTWSPPPGSEETHFLHSSSSISPCTGLLHLPKAAKSEQVKSQRAPCFPFWLQETMKLGVRRRKVLPSSSMDRRQNSQAFATTCSRLLSQRWDTKAQKLDEQAGSPEEEGAAHLQCCSLCLAANSCSNTGRHKCFSTL